MLRKLASLALSLTIACSAPSSPPPATLAAATLTPAATSVTPNAAETATQAGVAFTTINAAIQAAGAGAVIRIPAGTYNEQVEVNKAVTLEPDGSGPVWVDAECTRANGIHVSAANATVRGLGVKRSVDAAILVDGLTTSNVTLENNTLQDFDCQDQGPEHRAGIAVWYAGSGQRILNNTITRRVALSGNPVNGSSNCIWFKSNTENPSGGGHTISGNTLHGCYDGIGGEVEDDVRGGFDRNTLIENNTVTDCFDDGISVEGGVQNVTVRGNRIENCGVGIAFAPNLLGPLTIERNTIISDGDDNGPYGQLQCFKFGNNSAGMTYLTENECTTTGDGLAQTNPGLGPLTLRRNTIRAGRYVFEFSNTPTANSTMDEDCLYTSDTTRFVKWGSARYDTFAAFRTGTGQEANGRECPPASTMMRRIYLPLMRR